MKQPRSCGFLIVKGDPIESFLLMKHPARWDLPKGHVDPGETDMQCALRELEEETGISAVELEQFRTFGTPARDPRERVITVAYMGALPDGGPEPEAGDDAAEAAWFDVADLPTLAFDHDQVLAAAIDALRQRIETTDIAMSFLSDRFTLSDVQVVYEVIMGEQLDADVFRDWLLSKGWLEQTGDYNDAE